MVSHINKCSLVYSIMKSSFRSESPLVCWWGIGMEFHDTVLPLLTAGQNEWMCFAKNGDDTLMMAHPAS